MWIPHHQNDFIISNSKDRIPSSTNPHTNAISDTSSSSLLHLQVLVSDLASTSGTANSLTSVTFHQRPYSQRSDTLSHNCFQSLIFFIFKSSCLNLPQSRYVDLYTTNYSLRLTSLSDIRDFEIQACRHHDSHNRTGHPHQL